MRGVEQREGWLKAQGVSVAPGGDGKGARGREAQREGWSQEEGTCAVEEALTSGTGEDQKRMQHHVSGSRCWTEDEPKDRKGQVTSRAGTSLMRR